MEKTKTLVCNTWKTKTAASVLALISAVALPQLFHLLGMVSDLGSKLGETFLPMHIAIFFAAFFAGPWAAGFAGAASPVMSFALTTLIGEPMPALAMLPFMTVELASYGIAAGLLQKTKLPCILSLLLAQIAGRGVRAVAILLGAYCFGSPVAVSVIWTSVLAGLPGLILQWVLIPAIVSCVEHRHA